VSFGWLRPVGKWLLRTVIEEVLDELRQRREPPAPPAP
jgi:hypothetical protein